MSTKIYNGYIIKKKFTLQELNDRMILLREKFKIEIMEQFKWIYINQLYLFEDLYVVNQDLCIEKMKAFKLLNKITDSNNALKEIACNVLFNVREKVEEASKSDIYNVYDLSAEIQIYPLDDKILLRFFGNDRLEQILLNEEDIEEYHYQNQSDRPEDISEEEWNDREKNWETVNPTLVPAKRGFGVQLFYENDLPFMLDEVFTKMDVSILKHSLEKRTKLMAEQCYQYPKFTGNNWNVFMEPEYKEFIKEKSEEFRQPLINAGDPIEKLYQIYTK